MKFPSLPPHFFPSCTFVISFLGVLFCELSVHILAPSFYQIVSLFLVDVWEVFPDGKFSVSYIMV